MISTAVQKGDQVFAYNERNGVAFVVNGKLAGYTASTVTVTRGGITFVYDDRGHITATH